MCSTKMWFQWGTNTKHKKWHYQNLQQHWNQKAKVGHEQYKILLRASNKNNVKGNSVVEILLMIKFRNTFFLLIKVSLRGNMISNESNNNYCLNKGHFKIIEKYYLVICATL